MKLSNKVYDILMIIQLLALPIGGFLTQLLDIWGVDFPHLQQIVLTFGALNSLLGAILKISRDHYNAGGQNETMVD